MKRWSLESAFWLATSFLNCYVFIIRFNHPKYSDFTLAAILFTAILGVAISMDRRKNG